MAEKYVVFFGSAVKKTNDLLEKKIIELPTYSGPYSSFNRENPRDEKIMQALAGTKLPAHQHILDAKLVVNEDILKTIIPKDSGYRTYEF